MTSTQRAIAREPAGPGQESVWDYPRPPRLEPVSGHIQVVLGGEVVADTRAALRVLETSHPPTVYLPRDCFRDGVLREVPGSSYCEWKGHAAYVDLLGGGQVAREAGWFYPQPTAAYAALLGHVAVYPGRVDRCTMDGEVVQPQPGQFYGGWVTAAVVGPFKGDPGTMHW